MENWKSISGYEGLYEVSDTGRVRSLKFGKTRLLKPGKTRKGYLRVVLCKDGKVKKMSVHRLVAEAFVQNPLNLPQVNHRDENKRNNTATNLEWCSARYNVNYGTRNQRDAEAQVNDPKKSKPVQQLDMQGNPVAAYPSAHEAARVTGTNRGSICSCCLGKRKSAGGFVWRYAPTA